MIRIELGRCTGCGVCVDSCRAGAIRIIANHAVIDDSLCDQCEACISACPQEALSSVPVVVPASEVRSSLLPVSAPLITVPAVRPLRTTWRGRVLPLLGAVASLAVREIIPRVVDALVRAPATQGTARRIGDGGHRLRQRQRGRWHTP
jgi:NAD-dependent dihydropyrimidine dehydrogenase PreA subunit